MTRLVGFSLVSCGLMADALSGRTPIETGVAVAAIAVGLALIWKARGEYDAIQTSLSELKRGVADIQRNCVMCQKKEPEP